MRLKREQKVYTKHKGVGGGTEGGKGRERENGEPRLGKRGCENTGESTGESRQYKGAERPPIGQSVLVRVALTFSHQPSPGILPFGRHGGKQCL